MSSEGHLGLNEADRAALCASSLLKGARKETHDRAAQMAEALTLDPDTVVVAEGAKGDAVFVVVEGELSVSKRAGDRDVSLSVCKSGEMIGELSVLQDLAVSATVRTVKTTRLLRLPGDGFLSLLDDPAIARRLLHVVATRLANTQAQLQQSEKLASLGTIAAGIAHELNNPAAALARATSNLSELLARWEDLTLTVAAESSGELARLHAVRTAQEPAHTLDPLSRGDREDELADWLQAQGVAKPYELASGLVSAGFTSTTLADLFGPIPADAVAHAAEWFAVGAAITDLVSHVRDAAARISAVVKDVKGYSHLDQAARGPVQLAQQLHDTLALLSHKTPKGITVVRNFDPATPTVDGSAAELNQVWTNLIDNAIDAMGESGTLTLTTRGEGGFAVVEVSDDGSGIPDHVIEKIFDPFVTTKPVGSGTGLGLYLARDIVMRGHSGDLSVHSSPAGTTFTVRLPISPTSG